MRGRWAWFPLLFPSCKSRARISCGTALRVQPRQECPSRVVNYVDQLVGRDTRFLEMQDHQNDDGRERKQRLPGPSLPMPFPCAPGRRGPLCPSGSVSPISFAAATVDWPIRRVGSRSRGPKYTGTRLGHARFHGAAGPLAFGQPKKATLRPSTWTAAGTGWAPKSTPASMR